MKILLTFLILIQSFVVSFSNGLQNEFIKNNGQWNTEVLFMGSFPNVNVWVTKSEIIFDHYKLNIEPSSKAGVVLKMKFEDSHLNTQVYGIDGLESSVRYTQSNREFTTQSYKNVVFHNLYTGIDLVLKSENAKPRYDFVVQPFSNPDQIKVRFEGHNSLKQQKNSIDFLTSIGTISNGNLKTFQVVNGTEIPIESNFKQNSKNEFAFKIGSYDTSKELIIDPIVSSTFLGTALNDGITSMTVDKLKNVIVVGWTNSPTFPTSVGTYKEQFSQGGTDAFVAKFSPDMKNLLFCTYLGGSGVDTALCVKTDESNNIYVAGVTSSADFGVSAVAPDKIYNGQTDGFLIKLTPQGTRTFATYIGGINEDKITAIAIGVDNSIYATGCTFSTNFPTTTGVVDVSYNSGGDAFCTKIDANGTIFAFSTFLGLTVRNNNPAEYDCGNDILVTDNGDVIIVGETKSGNFPVFPFLGQWWEPAPAFLPISNSLKGPSDGFVVRLNGNASTYRYSSYFGGTGDERCTAVDISKDNRVVFTGTTNSTTGIVPITNAYQSSVKGMSDCFIGRFSIDWKIQAFTYFGESRDEVPTKIQINHSNGEVYLAGETNSQLFFTTNDAQQRTYGGLNEGFITRFNSEYNQVIYSTFVGGSQDDKITGFFLDENYDIYYAGNTNSSSGVIPNNVGFQQVSNGATDGFIGKLVLKTLTLTTPQTNAVWCPGSTVTIQWNTDYPNGSEFEVFLSSDSGKIYNSIKKLSANSFQYLVPNTLKPGSLYALKVQHISGLVSEINGITVSKVVSLVDQPNSTTVCFGDTVVFSAKGTGESVQYEWRKGNQIMKISTDSTLVIPNVSSLNAGNYTVTIRASCGSPVLSDVVTLTVKLKTKVLTTPPDKTIMEKTTLSLCPTYDGIARSYQWYFNNSSMGSGYQNECLLIPNINKNFEGDYRCVVSGDCGTDTTKPIAIKVDLFVSVFESKDLKFNVIQIGNETFVRSVNTSEPIIEMNIYNSLGTALEIPIVNLQGENILLPSSQLSSGYYFVHIKTAKQSYVLPFSVLK